ncbi:hypothetical protein E5D57_004924 [Metarhizium anisopliae]|nr:hypothetical protein E5D57_004924 [Metarhizium anisopliae]
MSVVDAVSDGNTTSFNLVPSNPSISHTAICLRVLCKLIHSQLPTPSSSICPPAWKVVQPVESTYLGPLEGGRGGNSGGITGIRTNNSSD